MNACAPYLLPLLAAAATTSIASAQLNATFKAKTKMVSTAYFSTTGTKTAEIPINTDLTGGKIATISNSATASTRVSFSNTANGLRIVIAESGNARYFSSSARSYTSTGSHQTLLSVTSAVPMNATLRATWSTRVSRGSSSSGSVDIGNNGSYEFRGSSANGTKDFPVRIDSKGLQIATTSSGRASASSLYRSTSYFSSLSVEILPGDDCLFFEHGSACGVALDGKNGFGGKVTLNVSGGSANANGVLVLGAQRVDLALPGTSCRLLVLPVVSVPIRLGATGATSITGTVPPVRPFAIPVQVGVPGAKIATSNALTLVCP